MAEQFLNKKDDKSSFDPKIKQLELQHVFQKIVDYAEENNKRLSDSHKFEPYWNYNDVVYGLKKKILHQGILHVTLNKTENAYVTPPCCILGKEDIHIIGLKSRNRAFEGDRVVVKIFNTKNWVKDETKKGVIKPTGRVVYILEYNHSRTSLGFIEKLDIGKPMTCLGFRALDPSMPPALITQKFLDWQRKQEDTSPFSSMFYVQVQFFQDILYSAKIESWPVFNVAQAKLTDVISEQGSRVLPEKLIVLLKRDVTSLIERLGLPRDCYEAKRHRAIQRHFSRLYNTLTYISKEDLVNRTNLTDQVAFTLSPHERTADDVCVAFSCVSTEDLTVVQVHVADVASYLCAGGVPVGKGAPTPKRKGPQPKNVNYVLLNLVKLMNKQAEEVCVGVSTIDRRVSTLLPPALRKICSLTPQEKKLALTFEFVVDASGKITSRRVFASLIQSTVHLTYAAFKKIVEKPSDLDWVSQNLKFKGKPLDDDKSEQLCASVSLFATQVIQTRPAPLRLVRPKVQFSLQQNVPRRVHVDYGLSELDNLVAFWLAQVDSTAGARLARAFPSSALLVRQPSPDEPLVQVLRDFLTQHLGLGGAGEECHVSKRDDENSEPDISNPRESEEKREETSSSKEEQGDPSDKETERKDPSESEKEGEEKAQLAKSLAKALERARTLDPGNQNLVPVLLVLLDKIMHEPELCTPFRAESTHHFSRGLERVSQLTSPLHYFSHILAQKQLLMSLKINKNHEDSSLNNPVYMNAIASKHNALCLKLITLGKRLSEMYLAMQLGYNQNVLYCQAIVVSVYENSVDVLVPSLYLVNTLYLDKYQVSTSMEGGLWVHQVKWASPACTQTLAHLAIIPVRFGKVEHGFSLEAELRHPLEQKIEGLFMKVDPQGAPDEEPAKDFLSRHRISLSQIEALLSNSDSTPNWVTYTPQNNKTSNPEVDSPSVKPNAPSPTTPVTGTPGKPAPLVAPDPAGSEKPKRVRKKKNKNNPDATPDGGAAAQSSWFDPHTGHTKGTPPTGQPSRIAEFLSSEIQSLTIASSEESCGESGSESNGNQLGDGPDSSDQSVGAPEQSNLPIKESPIKDSSIKKNTNGDPPNHARPSGAPDSSDQSVGAPEQSNLPIKESPIKESPPIPLETPVSESPSRQSPTSSNFVNPSKESPSGSNLLSQQSPITQAVSPITDRGESPLAVTNAETVRSPTTYNPLIFPVAQQGSPNTAGEVSRAPTSSVPSPNMGTSVKPNPSEGGIPSSNSSGGMSRVSTSFVASPTRSAHTGASVAPPLSAATPAAATPSRIAEFLSSEIQSLTIASSEESCSESGSESNGNQLGEVSRAPTSSVPSPNVVTVTSVKPNPSEEGIPSSNSSGGMSRVSTSFVASPTRSAHTWASVAPPLSAARSAAATPTATSPQKGSTGSKFHKKNECVVS